MIVYAVLVVVIVVVKEVSALFREAREVGCHLWR